MADISNLTYKELRKLEEQIEERKEVLRKSNDCIEGYKITFCVKFNPAEHQFGELNSPEEFGDYLANDVANLIVKDLGLLQSDVSASIIEEMTDKDKEDWKVFWEDNQ